MFLRPVSVRPISAHKQNINPPAVHFKCAAAALNMAVKSTNMTLLHTPVSELHSSVSYQRLYSQKVHKIWHMPRYPISKSFIFTPCWPLPPSDISTSHSSLMSSLNLKHEGDITLQLYCSAEAQKSTNKLQTHNYAPSLHWCRIFCLHITMHLTIKTFPHL